MVRYPQIQNQAKNWNQNKPSQNQNNPKLFFDIPETETKPSPETIIASQAKRSPKIKR